MASMTDVQVTSGKLKLKGGVSLGGKKRAKKKKKKRKKDHDDVISSSISSVTSNSLTSATKSSSSPSSKQNKRARTDDPSIKNDTRTAAEKKMDERLRIKEEQQMRQNVKTGYRQKVDKFNSYLESLSEHHDIPKVGNAGMG